MVSYLIIQFFLSQNVHFKFIFNVAFLFALDRATFSVLLSLSLILIPVPYFFPLFNCCIESKDCTQVSKLELVDDFGWILK